MNKMPGFRKELSRFLVAGFSAVGTDFGVYYLLFDFLGYSPAKVISFLSGTIVAYLINKYWTFEKKNKSYREMLKFLFLYLGTLIVNVAVNRISLRLLPGLIPYPILISFLLATGTSTILNFIGQKWWVFTDPKKIFDANGPE